MKVSKNLHNRVQKFSTSIAEFSTNVGSVSDSIKEMNALIEEGEKYKGDMAKFTQKSLSKLRKTMKFAKNFSEVAAEIADEADELLAKVVPEEVMGSEEELKNFSRKLRLIGRSFTSSSKNFSDITSEAKTVLDMVPESAENETEQTQEEAKSTSPSKTEGTEAGEEVTSEEVQTAPKTVNFSIDSYREFATKSIVKSFAEIQDDVDNATDLVKEVVDQVIVDEPEAAPAEEEVATEEVVEEAPAEEEIPAEEPVTEEVVEETPAEEVVEEAPAEEVPVEEEITEEAVLEFGEDAIASGDDSKAEELNKKLEVLESKEEGAGERVMTQLENFSHACKKVANFSSKNVFTKIAEFCGDTCQKLCSKDAVDVDDLSAKAEQLEKNLPGAGEVLTTVCECFGKILDFCGGSKNCVEEPAKVFCDKKAFSATIDEFVGAIDVEDKKFGRSVKTKCFTLQDALESDDSEQIKAATSDLAVSLDDTEDPVLAEFGEKLCKFAEEYAAELADQEEEVPAEEAEETVAVPAEIEEADQELNKVLDKIDEEGEHLKPEVTAFAKKLCCAYKSMKCFTEEQLEEKLAKVEDLKDLYTEAKQVEVPAEEETPAEEPTAPKVEEVKSEEESTLVDEEELDPNQLPSDQSIQNFSVKNEKTRSAFDPIDHLYSLNVR
jgi:hypothetical protein